jgi:hypothetical protein
VVAVLKAASGAIQRKRWQQSNFVLQGPVASYVSNPIKRSGAVLIVLGCRF